MDLKLEQDAMRARWANGSGQPQLSAYKEFRLKRPYRVMLYSAKKNAAKCNVPFNLTDNDITFPEYCPVLGLKLQHGNGQACDASPSLDRIRPSKGYVSGNVRVISYRANSLKSDATLEEMRLVMADLEHIHGNGQ